MTTARYYDIRDPIYGFIRISDWERDIINHPEFQRLRRIRQLAWTNMVYPGGEHSRFEHSLGVLHLATKTYDMLIMNRKYRDRLEAEFQYNEQGLARDRCLVRLAALLHDIGHGPFSHVAESLMPEDPEKAKQGKTGDNAKYTHEQYSAAIIRQFFRDVIEDNRENSTNHSIKADDVASLLEGRTTHGPWLFWRSFLSSQMDVDRMDYLLRDSYHCGVQYGRYDLDRLLSTLAITRTLPDPDQDQSSTPALTIGVEEGGLHAAEQLIFARYYMFTQLYFHKTRRAYDHHLGEILNIALQGQFSPPNTEKSLKDYLSWDDWRVLGLITNGECGEHGERIKTRNHYREVYRTVEVPKEQDLDRYYKVRDELSKNIVLEDSADKSWYKFNVEEIVVEKEDGTPVPLSSLCSSVQGLAPIRQLRLYTDNSKARHARELVRGLEKEAVDNDRAKD